MAAKKIHKWNELRTKTLSPEARRRVDEAVARDAIEITLQALREMSGKTQLEVADALSKTQGELSKMERRTDLLVSTLRSYIEALGGHLELRAVFDNRTVAINPLLTTSVSERLKSVEKRLVEEALREQAAPLLPPTGTAGSRELPRGALTPPSAAMREARQAPRGATVPAPLPADDDESDGPFDTDLRKRS